MAVSDERLVEAAQHGEPFVNAILAKVVDGRGRTRCYLQKETSFDEGGRLQEAGRWGARGKSIKKRPAGVPSQKGRQPRAPMRLVNGQWYLELPGLTLKLEKVEAVLDRIAAELGVIDKESGAVLVCDLDTPVMTLTVQQLREHINKW